MFRNLHRDGYAREHPQRQQYARVRDDYRRPTSLLCTAPYRYISVRSGSSQIPLGFTLGPNTYSCHFLMSKTSSTGGAENQGAHTGEQPAPEQDTLGLPEDSQEKENDGPSEVKLPSEISNSNTGPSQPSEPHEQESASKVAADDDLVPRKRSWRRRTNQVSAN
ncbi:hypothetical protein F4604DRAFT_1300036 [Suillus subluteus]|nr:hypothetical protein F4604DRAFT_1300036 [Suillus subluteus]